jgi:hypothetical protein
MKYKVNDTSSPAAMPVPAVASAKSLQYGMVHITGHPGNLSVPSPRPVAMPAGPLPRGAQPSYNSPDTIYPSVYYTNATGFGPPVRYFSNNEVPVPAVSYKGTPGVAFRTPHIGGRLQISWPPAPQAWQSAASQGGMNG